MILEGGGSQLPADLAPRLYTHRQGRGSFYFTYSRWGQEEKTFSEIISRNYCVILAIQ